MSFLRRVWNWAISNKLLVLFILLTEAFVIATVWIAIDNASLSSELEECQQNNSQQSQITPTEQRTIAETPTDLTDFFLPINIRPDTYDLYLYPDLVTGLFGGRVIINFTVLEPTNTMKIHSKGLNINRLEIEDVPSTFLLDSDHELIVITTTEVIPVGSRYVDIEFAGDMKNRIVGLYTSSYNAEDGSLRTIATSKFEPTYARQAFPCFDEPNLKANFKIHLLKPNEPSYIALSNMPVAHEEIVPGGVLVHFEDSVKMSTYLTCFIVSDFQYTSAILSGDTEMRVYATPAQIYKTQYALDVGAKVMEYFVDYFGIPFPLPKLDMAAIPDFVSGAMEHWGLVTYRETSLLYDPRISSTASKQSIATLISHELAHSWFGNLVTMEWWNDLWLNEGFAAYIEYRGVNAYDYSWLMLDQFLINKLHPVLVLDATLGSHSIVQTVTTPDEITQIFDTISYNKGASVLRMLENTVGEDIFKRSVTNYLKGHLYGNAASQDLWNELQTISGKSLNITEFMNSWTLQMGYPIVNVVNVGDYFVLTQKRFLTDSDNEGVDVGVAPYYYRWDIPITFITSETTVPRLVWFKYTESELRIRKPTGVKWVKFNSKQVGYYRVNYEREQWDALIQNVEGMSISDKTHLLEETFSIAESGQLSYEVPLSLSKYLKEEDNYIPWSVAATMFTKLNAYLSASEYSVQFKEHIIDLVGNAYNKLTWTETDQDTHLVKQARVIVLNLACSMGHVDCLATAKTHFEIWIQNGGELSQDLRQLVYNYGMASSDRIKWDLMWNKFIAETDAAEKLKLLKGLSSVNDPSLLTRLIQRAKDETYIRTQDYFTCLHYIAANPIGRPIVWDYVRENWEILVARFNLNDRHLGRLIPSVTSGFMTNVKLREIQEFFGTYPEAGAGTAARVAALESVRNNIKWLAQNRQSLESWLRINVVQQRNNS